VSRRYLLDHKIKRDAGVRKRLRGCAYKVRSLVRCRDCGLVGHKDLLSSKHKERVKLVTCARPTDANRSIRASFHEEEMSRSAVPTIRFLEARRSAHGFTQLTNLSHIHLDDRSLSRRTHIGTNGS